MENHWFEALRRRGMVTLEQYAELYRRQAELGKLATLQAKRAAALASEFGSMAYASHLWTCYDRPGGRLKWVRTASNLWTTQGSTWILQHSLTGTASYVAVISQAAVPTYAISDTAASHPGWTEVSASDVQQTTRPAVSWGAPVSGVVSNASSLLVYQMANAMVGVRSLQGGALLDNNAIGGVAGNLISEANFDQGAASVSASNQINILVQVTMLAG